MRLGLRDLLAFGPRAVVRYLGTLLSVFVVQSVVAFACLLAVFYVLVRVFASMPMFDDAVDGDLVSLLECVLYAKQAIHACVGIAFGGILLWQLASWFLVGGLYGVLAQKPDGRADTARCFGANGAATYLSYAKLALCSLPGWIVTLAVFSFGVALVTPRIDHALTASDLIVPFLVGIAPALLVLHVVWTVTDYARVELTLRHDTHDPGVVATYLRTLGFVLRRPITLVHGAVGWIAFGLVTVGYAYLSQGHPMYGAEGAVVLFVIRQGVSLARMAIRFGVLAGQVELGRSRPLPPRRVEVKVEAKAA